MKTKDLIDFLFEEEIKDDIDNNPLSKEKIVDFSKLDDEEKDSESKEKDSDPNRQGLIRNVDGAHLIYKRQNSTEQYDELWVWELQSRKIDDEIKVKKNILSGTDIPIDAQKSKDNEQYFELKTIGNVSFMKIFNLPS